MAGDEEAALDILEGDLLDGPALFSAVFMEGDPASDSLRQHDRYEELIVQSLEAIRPAVRCVAVAGALRQI